METLDETIKLTQTQPWVVVTIASLTGMFAFMIGLIVGSLCTESSPPTKRATPATTKATKGE